MRIPTLMTLFLLTTNFFGQAQDSLGLDNNVTLNKQESVYINSVLKESQDTFDFTNKKIAFVTGSAGGMVVSKSNYFKTCVKPWTDQGSKPRIALVRLTQEEKQKSGGYDALVLSWVKLFTNKQKRRILEQLKLQLKPE